MVRIHACGAILALLALAGCGGSSGPFDYIPVHGTVKYEDGSIIPAPGIKLQIRSDAPPKDGMYPRIAEASVNDKGEFTEATSLKWGDGIIPGKHRVALQYATDKDGKLVVPKEYTQLATSPLAVDAGDGNIDIKVPKP